MATKDQAALILKRMEEGTAEIFSRYEDLIRANKALYDQKIRRLDQEYAALANEASARAKIDWRNTLEKMADSGYVNSGETVQAQIASNAARSSALAALSAQKAKDKAIYETEKNSAALKLSAAAQEEASDYENEMQEAYREQTNFDREWKAEEAQRNFENQLALKKLEAEKESAAQKKSEKENLAGMEPEMNAYDYLEKIVEQNTKYEPEKGYRTVSRTGILQALNQLIRDNNLSEKYRYELYLYGKSLGYLS